METLGKYTLRKKIATGGMAEIWVATTSASGVDRVCVVKRILPHLAGSPDFVRMFLDEARIVATFAHPNIAQLYDVGEAGGGPFIAMEYLHGTDVRAIKRALRDHHPSRMPIEHALYIGIGAAAGLHYAHEKVGLDGRALNVVHRDISPQNLLVTFDGGVKVLDFGIAKSDGCKSETQSGTLKGKIPYMSPEQCECEPLDRRSDIYSLGVVLYELTTGHRVHESGAGEYEMLRAIVEGTVAPPTAVDPAYPPALERIILGCLAKDRRRRYPTARALQADLEAFAREDRLAVSSLALSSFMGELFGKRAEAWREALAGGEAELFELAARDAPDADAAPRSRAYGALLEGRGRSSRVSFTPAVPVEPMPMSARSSAIPVTMGGDPPARSIRPVDPTSDIAIDTREAAGVTVIALSGRINERFQGAVMAGALAGRVVLDLAGVTRVSSFGVRAWLEMLSDAAARGPEIFLSRCSEPVVNQLSMIKGFAGGGRVVSFYAPYRCERCRASFQRLVDTERDAVAIQRGDAPEAECPQCGAAGVFDDDTASYLAFAAPHVSAPVPRDVRAALDDFSRARGQGDLIEKAIDGSTTRIRVRAALDAHLRWKRVLDGIEGDLEIDLGAAPAATPEGLAMLESALGAIGPEVDRIRLQGCPLALAARLVAAPPRSRAEIVSIAVEGRCDVCDAPRTAAIGADEARAAAREGRDPDAPCKRCDAAISFADARPLLRRLAPMAALDAAARSSEPPSLGSRTETAAVTSSQLPARPTRARALFAAGALATGAAVAAALLWPRPGADRAAEAVAATASIAPAVAADSPPPWSARPIAVEPEAIFAVGRGRAETAEAALTTARDDAIDRVAAQLLEDLAGAPIAAFAGPRVPRDEGARRADVIGAAAVRYLAQVGATSTPERADTRIRRRSGEVEVLVRYRLRRDAYDAAVAFYRRTASFGGMTVAPVFPLLERTLRTSAAVLVIAVDKGGPAALAGVREGDALVAVNGQAVGGVDALAAAGTAGPLDLRLEQGGAARMVRIGGR